jgi:hypothetical protein
MISSSPRYPGCNNRRRVETHCDRAQQRKHGHDGARSDARQGGARAPTSEASIKTFTGPVFKDALSGKICVCIHRDKCLCVVSVSHLLLIKKKHNQIAEVNAISFLEKLMKLW